MYLDAIDAMADQKSAAKPSIICIRPSYRLELPDEVLSFLRVFKF